MQVVLHVGTVLENYSVSHSDFNNHDDADGDDGGGGLYVKQHDDRAAATDDSWRGPRGLRGGRGRAFSTTAWPRGRTTAWARGRVLGRGGFTRDSSFDSRDRQRPTTFQSRSPFTGSGGGQCLSFCVKYWP